MWTDVRGAFQFAFSVSLSVSPLILPHDRGLLPAIASIKHDRPTIPGNMKLYFAIMRPAIEELS